MLNILRYSQLVKDTLILLKNIIGNWYHTSSANVLVLLKVVEGKRKGKWMYSGSKLVGWNFRYCANDGMSQCCHVGRHDYSICTTCHFKASSYPNYVLRCPDRVLPCPKCWKTVFNSSPFRLLHTYVLQGFK